MQRLALLVFVLVPGLLLAQMPLTLEQAVRAALEKNPMRKAAWFHQRAASADAKQARAGLFPQISFAEAYERADDPVFVFGSKLRQRRFGAPDFALNVLNAPAPFGNFSTGFSGAWQIFDSGVNWMRVSQAKQADAAAVKALDRADQELIFRVVNDYMSLLLAQKRLEVATNAVATSLAILDRSSARFESGMVVESDLLSAKVDLAARRQDQISAQNGMEIARAVLDQDLGVPLDTEYQLTEVLSERELPSMPEAELEKLAFERRPDLLGMDLQTEIQHKSENMAKAAFGPSVNAFAGWQAENPHFGGGGENDWSAGVELKLVIFDGGAKLARLQEERAKVGEISARRDSLASFVRLEVRRAWLDLDAARQQVDVARAAIEESQESLRISQNRYEGGLTTITDLLRTGDAARAAESDYWQAVYHLHISYANLELATGTLDADSPVVKP